MFIDGFVMLFIFLFIGVSFNIFIRIVLLFKCIRYVSYYIFVLAERERQRARVANFME